MLTLSDNYANLRPDADQQCSVRGMVSLLDVIPRYANTFQQIERLLLTLEDIAANPQSPLIPANGEHVGLPDHLVDELNLVDNAIKPLDLKRTAARVRRMREYISSSSAAQTQYADLRHEITVLREALDDDLAERLVFFPSATSGDWYVFPHSIGEGMFLDSRETFPDANADMRDACNCYATDNYTAAVFHSMRVAEHGLRGLAKTLPVSFGKGRPVEFEQWGMIIGKLRQKIESLNAKSQEAKPKRQERLAFYSEAIDQCVYFKNLWRDDVSHARRGYSGSQALDGLLRVRDFMKLLADNGVKLPPKRP